MENQFYRIPPMTAARIAVCIILQFMLKSISRIHTKYAANFITITGSFLFAFFDVKRLGRLQRNDKSHSHLHFDEAKIVSLETVKWLIASNVDFRRNPKLI